MKKHSIVLFFSLFLSLQASFSATLYSRASTGFYTAGTWSTVGCGGASCACTPVAGDVVIICAGHVVTCNTSITVGPGANCASITIQSGGTLNMEPAGVLTVKNGGFLTVDAGGNLFVDVFTNNNNSDGVTINGTLTVSGVFTNGTGADIIGSGTIVLGAGTTFTNNGTIFGPTVLPVELLSFSAEADFGKVNLSWSTASETNNDYFSIERSVDGYTFETLKIVDGAGTTTSLRQYYIEDTQPVNGVNFYRLKQTDFGGASKFHEIVEVYYMDAADFEFYVYPNPNNGHYITLLVNTDMSTDLDLTIYDVTGRPVLKRTLYTDKKGSNNFSFSLESESLSSGLYTISLGTMKNVSYAKMMVN